jgi:hypothetical protein
MLPGWQYSAQLLDATRIFGALSLTMLNGGELVATGSASLAFSCPVAPGNASSLLSVTLATVQTSPTSCGGAIISPWIDIETRNWLLHKIDGVLIPSEVAAVMPKPIYLANVDTNTGRRNTFPGTTSVTGGASGGSDGGSTGGIGGGTGAGTGSGGGGADSGGGGASSDGFLSPSTSPAGVSGASSGAGVATVRGWLVAMVALLAAVAVVEQAAVVR